MCCVTLCISIFLPCFPRPCTQQIKKNQIPKIEYLKRKITHISYGFYSKHQEDPLRGKIEKYRRDVLFPLIERFLFLLSLSFLLTYSNASQHSYFSTHSSLLFLVSPCVCSLLHELWFLSPSLFDQMLLARYVLCV